MSVSWTSAVATEFGMLVPVELIDDPALLVLDTGATHTVIDGVAARERGIAGQSATGSAAHGEMSVEVAVLSSLSFGTTRLTEHPVVITELGPMLSLYGVRDPGPIGYLGHESLESSVVVIDCANERVGTVDEVSSSSSAVWVPGNPRWSTGPLVLDVTVNGSGPFALKLDSGSAYTVVSSRVAETAGIDVSQAARVPSLSGRTTGEVSLAVAEVCVGEWESTGQTVAVGDMLFGGPDGSEIQGYLGFNILRGAVTTLDYPHRRVGFESVR
jgi:predicted aspartyl protease